METARLALFELLTTDTILNGLGITAASTFNANDVDSPEMRPFVVVRWATRTPVFGRPVGRQDVSVWAHDDGTDYTKVDAIIKRVEALCEAATHIEGSDGSRISAMTYQGTSGDLRDDGYGTITRNTTWQALPHGG